MFPALAVYFFDAAPPGFDIARTKEGVGKQRVVRVRRMLTHQLLQRPVLWQLARIPKHDLVFVDTNLDGDAAAVILVHHGIEQGLA